MTSVLTRAPKPDTKLTIVDCDIHPTLRSLGDLQPYLEARWWDHLTTYGSFIRQGLSKTFMHPRMQPEIARLDAWPPDGGVPGSSLAFMQEQHLDPYNVEYGLLQPLGPGAFQRNVEFGVALCRAFNEWQVASWTSQDKRLKGAIVVQQEHAEAAVAEIERCGDKPDFIQITIPPVTAEPLGNRRYWPIYEAAVRYDLPVGLHVSGVNGHAATGGGWPSYYLEAHHSNVHKMQALIGSLIFEGVFERFPDLKIVLVEGGWAWVPAMTWRLDKTWERMRSEVPHVKHPPSHYVRKNFWFTTQPVEEPPKPSDLVHLIEWIGWDRLLFSTDYPHWDFDDPKFAFVQARMSEDQKRMLFRDNAKAVYRLS